jgi:hypothetical protein
MPSKVTFERTVFSKECFVQMNGQKDDKNHGTMDGIKVALVIGNKVK